ncbi:molybdopterin dinucleotide binding domain-containing protein, partial [Lonsdalea populi]
DAAALGLQDQQLSWVASRRGKVISRAAVSERINKGAVYMTYQWWIGACNELTLDEVDPIAKTPEYKHCAVRLEPIADQRWAEEYVQKEYSKLKAHLRDTAEVTH